MRVWESMISSSVLPIPLYSYCFYLSLSLCLCFRFCFALAFWQQQTFASAANSAKCFEIIANTICFWPQIHVYFWLVVPLMNQWFTFGSPPKIAKPKTITTSYQATPKHGQLSRLLTPDRPVFARETHSYRVMRCTCASVSSSSCGCVLQWALNSCARFDVIVGGMMSAYILYVYYIYFNECPWRMS